MSIVVFSGYIPSSRIAGSYGRFIPSFQRNLHNVLHNGFINLQVKKNFNWEVESIQVNGYDDGGYTYSYPGQYLYVMQPDYNSLETAKSKIKSILDENKSDN